MKLIDLVNSVIIVLSQIILLRWLTFLLGSLTVTLTVLLFWIYLFLLTLGFNLHLLTLHWEILIMLFSRFPLTSNKLKIYCPISLHSSWLFSCWLGWSSWSFKRCSKEGFLLPSKCQWCPHIETSQLIFCANQLTDFYMRATLALNGLNSVLLLAAS